MGYKRVNLDPNGQGGRLAIERVVVTGSEIPLPELPNIPDLLLRPPDLGALERFGSSNPGPAGMVDPAEVLDEEVGEVQQGLVQFNHAAVIAATTINRSIARSNDGRIHRNWKHDRALGHDPTTPAIDPINLLSGGIAALVRSSFRPVLQKAVVFWAGGRAGEDAARTFAKASGGTVIADTAAGRALAQSTANIKRELSGYRCRRFCENASGEVYVFQNARRYDWIAYGETNTRFSLETQMSPESTSV